MQSSYQRYIPAVAIALTAFLVVLTLNAIKASKYIGGGLPSSNVITVSGQGEAFSRADIATFSFGAEHTGSTVAEAQGVVTENMNAAINAVKGHGIDDKDIQTSDYSIYPKYEYGQVVCTQFSCPPQNQRLVGYTVSQSVTVKVRNVDNAGAVLGSLGSLNVTNVSGLSFTVDDPSAVEREARQEAIDDARAKAEQLAKDLDVRIVRIVNFSENGYPAPMYYKADLANATRAEEDAVSMPSIPVGENKVSSNVTITYEIR